MENAVDALKIGFAVFVFILAVTIAFSVISQAKTTADIALRSSDKTNYYQHLNSKENNRTASISDIISSLYRYNKESLCVIVRLRERQWTNYKFDTFLNNDEIEVLYYNDILTEKRLPANTKEIEKMIKNFIIKKLDDPNHCNHRFKEEFIEVPLDGTYEIGEDGSELVTANGAKKIYLIYTENVD